MAHYGIISLGSIGHLNPLCVLGRELQRRGNRVTYFGVPDIQKKVQEAGLHFRMIGNSVFPPGSMDAIYKQLGIKSGLDGLKYSIGWFKRNAEVLFQECPAAIRDASVDALIIDQTAPAGVTVAEYMDIPYVVTSTGLLLNRESRVPPFFTGWDYDPALRARIRNHLTNAFFYKLIKPIRTFVIAQRKQWGLPADRKRVKRNANYLYDTQLAQISQMPADFDFPRTNLPGCFHYAGPFLDTSEREPTSTESVSFPFERLTDKPLIYASFGTLQNQRKDYYEVIAEACSGFDVQLVIALGGTEMNASDYHLGNAVVVPYAPQRKLIKKASLVITHAGLNTVLETLTEGVPMVAVPITNEQPGAAARIKWCGAGEVLPASRLSVDGLKEAVGKVMADDGYRQNAERMKRSIEKAGGVQRAADIIERAIATNEPVL